MRPRASPQHWLEALLVVAAKAWRQAKLCKAVVSGGCADRKWDCGTLPSWMRRLRRPPPQACRLPARSQARSRPAARRNQDARSAARARSARPEARSADHARTPDKTLPPDIFEPLACALSRCPSARCASRPFRTFLARSAVGSVVCEPRTDREKGLLPSSSHIHQNCQSSGVGCLS